MNAKAHRQVGLVMGGACAFLGMLAAQLIIPLWFAVLLGAAIGWMTAEIGT